MEWMDPLVKKALKEDRCVGVVEGNLFVVLVCGLYLGSTWCTRSSRWSRSQRNSGMFCVKFPCLLACLSVCLSVCLIVCLFVLWLLKTFIVLT